MTEWRSGLRLQAEGRWWEFAPREDVTPLESAACAAVLVSRTVRHAAPLPCLPDLVRRHFRRGEAVSPPARVPWWRTEAASALLVLGVVAAATVAACLALVGR